MKAEVSQLRRAGGSCYGPQHAVPSGVLKLVSIQVYTFQSSESYAAIQGQDNRLEVRKLAVKLLFCIIY